MRRVSIERWGRDVALRYLEDIRAAAKQRATAPGLARLSKGPYRIFRVRSHDLIVHVDLAADRMTVARLLPIAMDAERHLP